jgi:hypothetical protein
VTRLGNGQKRDWGLKLALGKNYDSGKRAIEIKNIVKPYNSFSNSLSIAYNNFKNRLSTVLRGQRLKGRIRGAGQ